MEEIRQQFTGRKDQEPTKSKKRSASAERRQREERERNEVFISSLQANVDRLKDTFGQIVATLGNYDQKLIDVLGQHQDDFWFAFKTHMNKIEKELHFLQAKSKEQDAKLT